MTIRESADYRSRLTRTEAIVLRHSNWGEADRFVVLFTQNHGKLRSLAKGVRRMRSRKAGHLEPYTRAFILLAKARDLPIISQAETINSFPSLRDDLVLGTHASYVVELIDSFATEGEPNDSLYRLLVNTLTRLDSGENPTIVLHYYEIRMLDLAGYRPHLFQCSRCQEQIQPQAQFFSPAMGGVLCPKCGPLVPGSGKIGLQALKYLRHFQRSDYQQATRAQLSGAVHAEIDILMQQYLSYILERSLNSPHFLRRINTSQSEEKSQGTNSPPDVPGE